MVRDEEDKPLKPDAVIIPGASRADDVRNALAQLAWLMDRAYTLPGTKISVGLDALLGLFPGLGDLLTGLIQAGIVLVAVTHYRVPRAVAARMAANVLLDVAVGSIPLVGDLFDVAFKANTRNLALLDSVEGARRAGAPVRSWPSVLYLVGIGAVLGIALLAVAVATVALFAWVFRKVSQ